MPSPTIPEVEVEIKKLISHHLSLKNMSMEIWAILQKYEIQDKTMFLNYVNVKAIMTACVDMQTKVIAAIRTLSDSVNAGA